MDISSKFGLETDAWNDIDGRRETVAFDKITARINKLCYGLDSNYVDSVKVALKVCIL